MVNELPFVRHLFSLHDSNGKKGVTLHPMMENENNCKRISARFSKINPSAFWCFSLLLYRVAIIYNVPYVVVYERFMFNKNDVLFRLDLQFNVEIASFLCGSLLPFSVVIAQNSICTWIAIIQFRCLMIYCKHKKTR